MAAETLKFSICIPAYEANNRSVEFLSRAIHSVLSQSYLNWEIIIADHSYNNRVERFCKWLNLPKIKYYKNLNERGSSSANMNFATQKATGDIIKPLFMDDYLYSKDALSEIANIFTISKKTIWLAVGNNTCDDEGLYYNDYIPKWNSEVVFGKNTISSPSCIAYRKDCGCDWDNRLIWLMDCVFYQKLFEKHGEPYILDKILVTNFAHKFQVTNVLGNPRKEWEEQTIQREYAYVRNYGLKTGDDVIIDDDIKIKRPELANFGSHIAIDKGFYCTTKITLGNYIHISPYVTCIGGAKGEFEAKGFNNIMAGARIICGSDRFDGSGIFGAMIPEKFKGKQIIKPVIMERFSNLGTNSIIMPGSRLRKGVLLCAGSLLIGDTEEWGVYKGNPAVMVKKIDGTKIEKLAENLK